jgi:hypothetical protein
MANLNAYLMRPNRLMVRCGADISLQHPRLTLADVRFVRELVRTRARELGAPDGLKLTFRTVREPRRFSIDASW